MQAKILSLNSGFPEPLEWEGKTVITSMRRHPVPGPLVVHDDRIDGNAFGAPHIHGQEYGVIYAYGLESAREFTRLLGRADYEPALTGENLTLDRLDESQISVGDVFEMGEVLAQAAYPRIPCGKVNMCLRHADAQKAMQRCGRSGIYFRVLRTGKIFLDSPVKRVEEAKHRFSIFDLYAKMVNNVPLNEAEMRTAVANGAFPKKAHDKWVAALSELQS